MHPHCKRHAERGGRSEHAEASHAFTGLAKASGRLLLSVPALLVARFFGHREVINAGRAIHKRAREALFLPRTCAVRCSLPSPGQGAFISYACAGETAFLILPARSGGRCGTRRFPARDQFHPAWPDSLNPIIRLFPSTQSQFFLSFLSTLNVAVFFSTCAILTP